MPIVALVVASLAGCHASEDPGFDTLLVSIDGTPPALLDEEWADLTAIPAVAAEGSLQTLAVEGVTDTMASHARLLTGYGEDVTNVDSAFHWEPLPKGITVPERLKKRWGPNLRAYWVVNKPTMLGFDTEDQPFWFAGRAVDVAVNREMKVDPTNDMVDALRSGGDLPFFAFFHWGGVDHYGHEEGERSDAQREELRRVDGQLAVVLAELEALGRLDRTRIYVVTDHGFKPEGDNHYVESEEVFLATNDPAIGQGEWLHQLAWTIMESYGVAPEDREGATVGALPGL